ncbi:MAG: hypothetical protein WBY44_33900 [Bryobacteraceae bacterium]|jgi:hypothetical protein
MPNSFSPTPRDVERYRRLRAVSVALNHKIVKTIPRQAYDDIGDALGIRRNGVLVFDSEDMTSVMSDCCLYDWYENGKNLVQRYAEAHPALEETEESYLLQACLQAQYRVLVADSVVPGAGIHCHDVLNGGGLFLMDLAISQGVTNSNVALATRTIPLGEYWMTGGAGLPINSQESAVDALRQIARDLGKPPQGARGVALTVARACLAAGAASHVRYESAEASPKASAKKPLRMPRWPGSKRRRR